MARASVRVRPADGTDIPGLIRLSQAVTPSRGGLANQSLDLSVEHLAERFAEILAEKARTLLVAIDEFSAEVVGLLVARRDEIGAIDLTAVLHVTHLMVLPDHRRRGVGRALLTSAVLLADEVGLDRVLATAGSGSREANRYLARLGFAPLTVHRVAPVSVLRRTLGMTELPERIAVLRRVRLARNQPGGPSTRANRGA